MTIQCCKCRKVKHGAQWKHPHAAPEGPVSHGFCPACYLEVQAEIQREQVPLNRARLRRLTPVKSNLAAAG